MFLMNLSQVVSLIWSDHWKIGLRGYFLDIREIPPKYVKGSIFHSKILDNWLGGKGKKGFKFRNVTFFAKKPELFFLFQNYRHTSRLEVFHSPGWFRSLPNGGARTRARETPKFFRNLSVCHPYSTNLSTSKTNGTTRMCPKRRANWFPSLAGSQWPQLSARGSQPAPSSPLKPQVAKTTALSEYQGMVNVNKK